MVEYKYSHSNYYKPRSHSALTYTPILRLNKMLLEITNRMLGIILLYIISRICTKYAQLGLQKFKCSLA